MEPQDADQHYSEKLIRLPNLALAYRPPMQPANPKIRADFGLPANAFLCLSTQSLFKYLPQYDDIFPRIASQASEAIFVFLSHGTQDLTDQFSQRLAASFAAFGLQFEHHCRILPRQNFQDFLSLNACADVLLDTFAWSGGKTTLEAISCGLPVVTCPAAFMRGRHAYAMLLMMGLTDLIAKDKKEYVAIVQRLCLDNRYYTHIRSQVQTHRFKLYNDRSCIEALEKFYRAQIKDQLSRLSG